MTTGNNTYRPYSPKLASLLACMLVLFSSCLKKGLEPPNYASANAITDIQFEHRWTIKNSGGVDLLRFQAITVTKTIDDANSTVTLTLTVPPASTATAFDAFNSSVRASVSRSSLACFFFVSQSASVRPLNGAPVLGTMGNFSGDTYQYEVIAGNGNARTWTIKIAAFNKP